MIGIVDVKTGDENEEEEIDEDLWNEDRKDRDDRDDHDSSVT